MNLLTAQKIDEEVKGIITDSYDKTSQLIKENLDTLHKMANALLEKETLDGKDIDRIMGDSVEQGSEE